MIVETSNYLQSSTLEDEVNKLFFTLYHPKELNQIKATLLILHGMQEHSGRYASFARFLAENGVAVLTYDHLGHGKTADSLDKHGYFTAKNARQQVVIDAENMAAYLEQKFTYVPHFVLGHSMGSFITRCLLQVAQQQFDGAIIVGTGGKIPGIGIAKCMLSFLNRIASKKRSVWLNTTFAKMNNQRFKNEVNEQNTNWLSVNKENRKAFIEDKLCGIPFTFNGFDTLVRLNIDATKRNWAAPLMKHFPMYFVSGEDDPIGNFGKGVKQTVDDLKKDGFSNIELSLYPKMRHEILNEDNKKEVQSAILGWINKQLEK
jgi:alpha-beta hydrolase superfamily lysophospholipase